MGGIEISTDRRGQLQGVLHHRQEALVRVEVMTAVPIQADEPEIGGDQQDREQRRRRGPGMVRKTNAPNTLRRRHVRPTRNRRLDHRLVLPHGKLCTSLGAINDTPTLLTLVLSGNPPLRHGLTSEHTTIRATDTSECLSRSFTAQTQFQRGDLLDFFVLCRGQPVCTVALE